MLGLVAQPAEQLNETTAPSAFSELTLMTILPPLTRTAADAEAVARVAPLPAADRLT